MKWCTIGILILGLLHSPTVAEDKTAGTSRPLDLLLDAIAHVESNGDPHAVGDNGRALGMYQIHRAYWKDGTRFLGVDWAYEQARDPLKARRVVRAYLLHYGRGKSLLDMARIHNGGPRGHRKRATRAYARKIAEVLEETSATS
jgi:hypothetical protein